MTLSSPLQTNDGRNSPVRKHRIAHDTPPRGVGDAHTPRDVCDPCYAGPAIAICGLFTLLLTTPALAENAQLKPGLFVKITRSYDSDANTFSDGAPEGEAAACFQVTEITSNGVRLDHISGPYHPWWSDTAFAPGTYDDLWFSSEAYLENNPGAGLLDELERVMTNVPTCDDTS